MGKVFGFQHPEHLDRIVSWLVMALTFCTFVIYCLIRRHYRKRGPILCVPTQVGPVLEDSDTWQQKVGPVVFHCCHKMPVPGFWSPPRGTRFIRDFLRNQYGVAAGGEANVRMPDEVEEHLVAVSIPAKNFRCGDTATEFSARDDRFGFWSYQMVCGGVQMTLFHVEDDTFVAGVTIYAANRWAIVADRLEWAFAPDRLIYQPHATAEKTIERRWCRLRHQWIIITSNQFGEVDKFEFNGDANRLEPIECFECCVAAPAPDAHPLPDCLNWLKVEFCSMLKKPVMIGRNASGTIVHFNWNSEISKFQLKTCRSCASAGANRFETSQGADDKPPSYEYLELIEMVEQPTA